MPTKTKTEKASAAPEVREALTEEKANQEKISATVQAQRDELLAACQRNQSGAQYTGTPSGMDEFHEWANAREENSHE